MTPYCVSRSSRPARLFSFALLDVPLRVRLRRSHLREAYGPLQTEEQQAPPFGLDRLATAFLNNPGFWEVDFSTIR